MERDPGAALVGLCSGAMASGYLENSDDPETRRQVRNRSEKLRRDQFNALVRELATLVGCGGRKVEKSAVLRAAIAFLQTRNEQTARQLREDEPLHDWKPPFLSSDEFAQLMLGGLEAFVLAFSSAGTVLFVSESVSTVLDQLPADLLSGSVYDLLPAEQAARLRSFLEGGAAAADGLPFSLQLHLRRGPAGSPGGQHQPVQLQGLVHFPAGCLEPVFIAVCRPQTSQLMRDLVPDTSWSTQFTSRHSLEWKFLFVDHRASHLIGYSALEVLGTSLYDYCHGDDLERLSSCHQQLLEAGRGTSCFYRFLTKAQRWLWLQTLYYITYHQWNSKPEFIVCSHSVVDLADVWSSFERGPKVQASTLLPSLTELTDCFQPAATSTPWRPAVDSFESMEGIAIADPLARSDLVCASPPPSSAPSGQVYPADSTCDPLLSCWQPAQSAGPDSPLPPGPAEPAPLDGLLKRQQQLQRRIQQQQTELAQINQLLGDSTTPGLPDLVTLDSPVPRPPAASASRLPLPHTYPSSCGTN